MLISNIIKKYIIAYGLMHNFIYHSLEKLYVCSYLMQGETKIIDQENLITNIQKKLDLDKRVQLKLTEHVKIIKKKKFFVYGDDILLMNSIKKFFNQQKRLKSTIDNNVVLQKIFHDFFVNENHLCKTTTCSIDEIISIKNQSTMKNLHREIVLYNILLENLDLLQLSTFNQINSRLNNMIYLIENLKKIIPVKKIIVESKKKNLWQRFCTFFLNKIY